MEDIDQFAKTRKSSLLVLTVDEPPLPQRPATLTVQAGSTQDKRMHEAMVRETRVFISTPRDVNDADGASGQPYFYDVGAIGIVKSGEPDEANRTMKYFLQPQRRARIVSGPRSNGELAEVEVEEIFHDLTDSEEDHTRILAVAAAKMFDDLREKIEKYTNGASASQEIAATMKMSEAKLQPRQVADMLTYNVPALFNPNIALMQRVIEAEKTADRLQALIDFMAGMEKEFDMFVAYRDGARQKFSKDSSIHFLNEQKKEIDRKIKELNPDEADDEDELESLKKKIDAAGMPEDIKKEADKGFKRLKKINPSHPDFHINQRHLEFMAELPWNKSSVINNDISRAAEILDEDHYGLEKVKEEIIEHLAVLARPESSGKGKIICLVGPPGVGKTSIGKSIAKATGREFIRVSLGGIHDEAAIRGHVRTYVGALPGRIAEAIKKAGTNNPMIQLDEVDKTAKEPQLRGSVDNALLELLDPEQNSTFRDHYLGVELDLSKALFVCTANYPDDIPPALKDRMEIVSIDGYLDEQKLEIAKRYLVPKKMKQAGLGGEAFSVSDEALRDVINYYTREAGVRKLEQRIGKLCSKTAVMIAKNSDTKADVTADNLTDFLGTRKYSNELPRKEPMVGVVTGLAYTQAGGDTLSIEAVKYPGGGALVTTGNLQKVIDESVRVALGVAKSQASQLGINPKIIKENDLQIHFPAGATPKDGPSAGAAITTAVVSLLTGRKVRNDLAMTGEINLSGMVTEIGGLAQKFQAAVRSGIKTVLIPQANMKDVADIPKDITGKLEIIPVETIDDVLKYAFVDAAVSVSGPQQHPAIAARMSDDGRFQHFTRH